MPWNLTRDNPSLDDVLSLHRKYERRPRGAISWVLGDGFLCQRNAMYGQVRTAFLEHGYRIVKGDRFHYREMRLFTPPHILERKTVPSVDVISALRYYSRLYPHRITFNGAVVSMLPQNFLLHESAHCLAHDVLMSMPTPAQHPDTGARRT